MDVVLHVNTASRSARSPTMRIASYVADVLKLPLACNPETARHVLREHPDIDVLFVKPGMLKFSEHRNEVYELYARARRIVILENDYTFKPDPRLLRINPTYEVWTTVPHNVLLHGGSYVNWNILTWFAPEQWKVLHKRPFPIVKNTGLLYYGAFRKDRVDAFKRWFSGAKYPLTISTFRGRAAFQELAPSASIIGAGRDPRMFAQYAATLYIEDTFSSRVYCSPANRFYECLKLGVAQLFDESAVATFDEAGFNVRPYVVNTQKDIASFLHSAQYLRVRKEQRVKWVRNFEAELRKQVKAAYANLRRKT